jgi:hypothetical protein
MKLYPKHAVVKVFSLTAVLCLPLNSFAGPDDFEAYKKQQMQGAQQVKAEFREYKEKQDREFADFLKTQWSEFNTFKGNVRIKEPKPKRMPVVVPLAPPVSPKAAPAPVVVVPILAPVTPPPPPPQPKPVTVAADELELLFYGNAVKFVFDPKWKSYRLTGGAKPETISDFWTTMSGTKYEPTIQAVNTARRELKLDDWGYVMLWRDVVRALQPERKTEQNLLLWYFLVKSGYDMRLGYYEADVFLFAAIKQPVYATKYTKVNNQTYYAALSADHGNGIRAFYSYKSDYPIKLSALDIKSAYVGFTKTVSAQRALAFDYKGKTIKFTVPYDRRLVEYMGTFPQSEFELYFDTDGSSLVKESLLAELKKYTATMGEEEAVNFLLTFVQKAFAYKTDDDQFGYEKYFFVEESLHFPYNDCEDRAVLFTWLVHELVGIKAIGLLYPGHMTAAVALKQVNANFATVDYHGSRFVIADPTYIGASVGMAMPSYAKFKPTRVVDIVY